MKLVIKILLIALIPTILLGEQTKDVMVTYGQSADLIVTRKITKRANDDFMGNKELIQAQTDVSKKILENRLGLIRKSFMGFYGQLAYGCQAVVERVAQICAYLKRAVSTHTKINELQHDDLEKFLFCGQYWVDRKYNKKPQNLIAKETIASQEFKYNFKKIIDNFVNQKHYLSKFNMWGGPEFKKSVQKVGNSLSLLKNRIALWNILNKYTIEESVKKRDVLFHARTKKQLLKDFIFKKLLEIYYDKPIKESWHTLHYKKPQQYATYESGQQIKQQGCDNTTMFYNNTLFTSTLLSTMELNDVLTFLLSTNLLSGRSVGKEKEISELFNLFGEKMQTYYQKYKKRFDELQIKADSMHDNTLLMFSIDKKISGEFSYTCSRDGGEKVPVHINKNDMTFDTSVVLQTLKKNPNSLKSDKVTVLVLSQDKINKNGKLEPGITNPFNSEIDIYRFNIGEDEKIAKEIEQGVDELFKAIRSDMVNDGLLEDTFAWDNNSK